MLERSEANDVRNYQFRSTVGLFRSVETKEAPFLGTFFREIFRQLLLRYLDRAMIVTLVCFTRQGESSHILFDPERSLGNFEHKSHKVKVTDLLKIGRAAFHSMCLDQPNTWEHLPHVSTTLQSKVIEEKIYWPYDIKFDLIWPIKGS